MLLLFIVYIFFSFIFFTLIVWDYTFSFPYLYWELGLDRNIIYLLDYLVSAFLAVGFFFQIIISNKISIIQPILSYPQTIKFHYKLSFFFDSFNYITYIN